MPARARFLSRPARRRLLASAAILVAAASAAASPAGAALPGEQPPVAQTTVNEAPVVTSNRKPVVLYTAKQDFRGSGPAMALCAFAPTATGLPDRSTVWDCGINIPTSTPVPVRWNGDKDLPDGDYHLRIASCLWFANWQTWVCDDTPSEVNFRIDNAAPTVAFGPAGPADGAHIAAAISIDMTASEPVTFHCQIDGKPAAECSNPRAVTFDGDGDHSFTFWATDAAGFTSSKVTRSYVVDTTAPETTIDPLTLPVLRDPRPTLTYSATDADSELETRCQLNDGISWTPEPCDRAAWTPAADLAEGFYTFEVQHIDRARNVSRAASIFFTIDLTPPDISELTWVPATATVEFSGEPAAETTCAVDGARPAPCSAPFDASQLAPGSHELVVRVTDLAGNIAERRLTFIVPTPPEPAQPEPTTPGPDALVPPAPGAPGAAPGAETPLKTATTLPAPGAAAGTGQAPSAPAAGPVDPVAALAAQTPDAIAGAFGLPQASVCLSKRNFLLHPRSPKGLTIKRASVWVNGRKAKTKQTKGRWAAAIDLRGLKKQRVAVKIRVTLTTGKQLTGVRTFRTCGAK